MNKEEQLEKLKNMTFSYSSMNSYKTCPKMFFLTYFDKVERKGNIFSDLGNLMHYVMEEYFKGNVEIYEMDKLFSDNYSKFVTYNAPQSLQKFNYESNTMDKLIKFLNLNELGLDRDDFEVLCMEDKIEYEIDGIKLVIKPDAIFRRKSDGKVILYDYKTSGYKKDTHTGYAYQCSLYAKVYELVKGVHVDEINIIYFKETSKPRNKPMQYGRSISLVYDENVLERFVKDVKDIFKEEEWKETPEDFFCESICSVSSGCSVYQSKYGF